MATAERLTVLTWNVGRLHLGRLGRLVGHDSRARDRAMAHVARVVEGADADVVVLQELAGPWQLHRLAARLGGGLVPKWGGGHTDRMVGMLVRGALRPTCEAVPLAGGRGAVSAAGEGWAVLGVHLEPFDAAARARQVEDLVAWVAHRPEAVVVVAGDLNLDTRHPLHQEPLDRAAFAMLTGAARGLEDLGAAAGPTVLLGRRLDYVLGRGFASSEVDVLGGVRVPLGDHDPVRARLSLSSAARARLVL